MNSRSYRLIVILIVGSIVMGACSALPAAATATLPPIPTPTGPGGFPTGTFKPDHQLYASSMVFTPFGTFVVVLGTPDTGSYVVKGDQIVFNVDAGICRDKPGTYHWEIHGNTLTFKPINETCTASSRSDDMVGRSWIRQP